MTTNVETESGSVTGKGKGSCNLGKICNFFVRIFCGRENTDSTTNLIYADEAIDKNINSESDVRKEVLVVESKGNDEIKASWKDVQYKDNNDSLGPVRREDDTWRHINTTVKRQGGRRSARNLIQKRSKSAEGLCGRRHSPRSKSPKPCKFKTEDGGLFCEVCSWTSRGGTLGFLEHCNTRRHKERMKSRFNSSEDISGFAKKKQWISELGLIFIEPDSEDYLRCKLCNKLFPSGKYRDTFLVNIEIHVKGKTHVKKLEQVQTMSNDVASLMKLTRKFPTRNHRM